MQLVEIFVLALASMIWPTLLAVVAVALASPQPVKLLSSFLAGALVTTTTVGVLVVFLLQGSSLFSGSHRSVDPTVYLTVGGAALFLAYWVRRGGWPARLKQPGATPKGPSWSERALARGAMLACVAGIVLNLIPGVFPLVALKDIVELDYGVGTTVALIVGFYLVMFLPAEVPLVSYIVAPAKTEQTVADLRDWLARNTRRITILVLTWVGIYLVVRGVVSLVRAL